MSENCIKGQKGVEGMTKGLYRQKFTKESFTFLSSLLLEENPLINAFVPYIADYKGLPSSLGSNVCAQL